MDTLRNRGSAFSVVLATVIVCVAGLAGCVGTAAPEVDPGHVDTSAPNTGTTAPQPENTSQAVSVELAQLPIGGNTTQDQTTSADTCVTINWIVQQDAAKIPSDVKIQITGAAFSTDVYTLADQGCANDHPACIGFVFDAGHQACNLAITPTGSLDSTGTEPAVSLGGNVTCVDGQTPECTDFLNAVATEPSVTIPLDPPPSEQGAGPAPSDRGGAGA
ncbi:hypothetical protein [Diaminobutyricibacter sp. McL0608]|uniref:hypothetical protein n=1 Tax=Leifsonia sp. McL0608 TaxID=3143537 RepID=UPI0031F3109E